MSQNKPQGLHELLRIDLLYDPIPLSFIHAYIQLCITQTHTSYQIADMIFSKWLHRAYTCIMLVSQPVSQSVSQSVNFL